MPGRVGEFEIFLSSLDEHRGGERPKGLAELDFHVDEILHLGPAGIGEDAPLTEGAGSPLEASLTPTDHVTSREPVHHSLD